MIDKDSSFIDIQVTLAELRKDIAWIKELFTDFKHELDQNLIQMNQIAQTMTDLKGQTVLREQWRELHEETVKRVVALEGQRQNFLGKESIALLVLSSMTALGIAIITVWLKTR